ncbi:MAG: hypothetical protein K0R93_1490 [Anaerosolibacter sp.]|uniref:flagellin lysine-N-methylase n=1 Tax=Anaerosolibacter sp. TaxID=1872527 RepID=UPI0026332728|nr:flagellin lysine-N-methylase [Anaerosolibacter sp.]MDF2546592.1 hypothetical protein [Anaerosolibacter sp.]
MTTNQTEGVKIVAASNKNIVLIPQYMKKFKCIGSSCEDTCCAQWGITIDKRTYKKYNNCRNHELKRKFEESIIRNRKNPSDEQYAKVKLREDGSCPFLDAHKLCEIHGKLGEDFLSTTCRIYPRNYNKVNGIVEKSANLSCPEIARLVLLSENVMEFEQAEEDNDLIGIYGKNIEANNITRQGKLKQCLLELRVFTIQVLQTREYKLWERLAILGIFYQSIQELIQEDKLDDIPELVLEYIEAIEKGAFDAVLGEIIPNETVQLELLKQVINRRIESGLSSIRFVECYNEFVRGLNSKTNLDYTDVIANYTKAYELYYKPFMETHEYMLENYLVNYVFKGLFPVSSIENVFENYVLMVTHYSLIKMHLIGMIAYHKADFTREHVVKLIQSFSKVIEHNHQFIGDMVDYLKENDFMDLSYILLMIKN